MKTQLIIKYQGEMYRSEIQEASDEATDKDFREALLEILRYDRYSMTTDNGVTVAFGKEAIQSAIFMMKKV